MYNEEHYRFHSSMSVAEETELLIVVGTSGATNLPNHVVSTVLQRGGMIIDVNIEASHFSLMAMSSHRGCYLEQPSGIVLPELVKLFKQMRLSSTN
jgi:NAD-dependent deacetylase